MGNKKEKEITQVSDLGEFEFIDLVTQKTIIKILNC